MEINRGTMLFLCNGHTRPLPTSGLEGQMAGVKKIPASTKSSETTRAIYLGVAKWVDPPLIPIPGQKAGSPFIRGAVHTPFLPQRLSTHPPGLS